MKPTDKRFWIWVIAVTMLLSAMPMIMYGENIIGIILIILSYFIASAICLRMASVNNKVFTWFMLFCASCGAYIIDIILIDSFRLVKMESYPLIVGQIYLFPICALTQGLICLFGGIIMNINNKKRLHKNMCSSKILILFLLISLTSCSDKHDITDNYSVFTYGEGLYGEKETDYPIFAAKLGYEEFPTFIPHIEQSWWNHRYIVLKQSGDIFWIIKSRSHELDAGDIYLGPLTACQKDSILTAERIDIDQMEHRKYE